MDEADGASIGDDEGAPAASRLAPGPNAPPRARAAPLAATRPLTNASVGTPLTTNHFLGTDEGECYGRSATPARWLAPELSPYTPLRNFYLTGQDITTLGLTGAIAAGYLTANVLTGYGGVENILLQRELCQDLGVAPAF